jgi:dephospho-CoA kinase
LILEDRQNFQKHTSSDVVVFDIPLLFETGADKEMDKTVCVFTSTKNQMERLKNRNKGHDDYYKELMSKQMPSNEKCDLADYVIETTSHTAVEKRVIEILDILRA